MEEIIKKVDEELTKIKEAREKLEALAKDFETVKEKVTVVDYGMNQIVKAVKEHKEVLSKHRSGILELDGRLTELKRVGIWES